MITKDTVEVVLNGTTLKWYRDKGYTIPTETIQLYCRNKKGNMIKNGTRERVPKGTKITVKIEDLPPKSNQTIECVCETCNSVYTTTYQAYLKKVSNNCCSCQAKKTHFKGGTDAYWVNKLIKDNPDAKCDISGETDKRFLVLHHLLSRSNGGVNEESNYVILSANYHLAFHNSLGGFGVASTPDDYYEFKKKELETIAKNKIS